MIRNIESEIIRTFEGAGVRSVLVAVSGGADSVALLCASTRVASRIGLRVEAANCNFHLRGEESDRDSAFTAELCSRLGVKLHSLDYDVALYMEGHPKLSTEMACRELRYADFYRICREENLDCVAVAHNADDDIETMLLALLRGSGTRGLRGMDAESYKETRESSYCLVIRPLLGISRAEIEEYLTAIGQDFVTDSSNLTSDYRRNFLRRDVIPMLESRWPGTRKSLARTLSIIKEESKIVEEHYRRQLEELRPDQKTLLVKTATETARGGCKPPFHVSDCITTGTVLRFLEPFGGNPTVAEEIMNCLGKDFGERSWRISGRYEVVLERDRLEVVDLSIEQCMPRISWEKQKMSPQLMDEIKRNRGHNIIYLPNDPEAYDLRRPMRGDRMAPLGMKGTRLVSDIISDARLDRKAKKDIEVLTRQSDGEIIWVTGLKRSRHELVDTNADWIYKAVYNQ